MRSGLLLILLLYHSLALSNSHQGFIFGFGGCTGSQLGLVGRRHQAVSIQVDFPVSSLHRGDSKHLGIY